MNKHNNWNWYSAKIIYEFIIVSIPDQYLIDEYYLDDITFFEESIILIKAQSFSQAFKFATNRSISNNYKYTNKYNQAVERKFYDVIECFAICDNLEIGTEVHSNIYSKDKNKNIENIINEKYFYDSSEQEHINKMHILRHK